MPGWVFGVAFLLAFIIIYYNPENRSTGEEKEEKLLSADYEEKFNNNSL